MAKKNTIKINEKNVAKKESKTAVKEVSKTTTPEVKEVKEVKASKVEPKVEKKESVVAAKSDAKATVKATVKKEATKKATGKSAAVKEDKVVAKKEEAKPVAKAKEEAKTTIKAKAETKVEAKAPAKKATVKKEAAKKEEAKPAKKETAKEEKVVAKKETAKTATKAKEEKTVAKKATTTKKAPAKKEAPKKAVAKKKDVSKYNDISLDTCLNAMRSMNVGYEYADYCRLLLDEADLNVLEKNIIEGNNLKDKKLDFTTDGYDLDVVMATLVKVSDTMELTAADFKTIKKDMDACVKTKLVVDADENSKHYLNELKVAEKVLMVGQRKNITTAQEATALLKSDVRKFFEHLKGMAYAVLRNWKYEDVEFYQEFAFAFVSQYTDMFVDFQNEIQMDCADLYILHGDEGRGDHEYNYVLRENEIKDYIYYRFANVYVERNLEKAKSIANSSFQWVDDRFDYFKKIVEIIEK